MDLITQNNPEYQTTKLDILQLTGSSFARLICPVVCNSCLAGKHLNNPIHLRSSGAEQFDSHLKID